MIGSRILPPYGDSSNVCNDGEPGRLGGRYNPDASSPQRTHGGNFHQLPPRGRGGLRRAGCASRSNGDSGASRVFRDVDTLRPGQDFVQAIESRLTDCRVMLAVIGREWASARDMAGSRRLDEPYDFVRLEIAAALARPNVLVVPVLVEGAAMPAASELPENIRALARRHAVTVRDETWDADVDRLVGVIESAISMRGSVARRRADLRRRGSGWRRRWPSSSSGCCCSTATGPRRGERRRRRRRRPARRRRRQPAAARGAEPPAPGATAAPAERRSRRPAARPTRSTSRASPRPPSTT